MNNLIKISIVVFFILFIFSNSDAQIVVKVKPVRPKVVVVKPARPGQNFIWVDGYWKTGPNNNYVWVKSHWKKNRKGHNWIPGHWKKVRSGWKWIPGHWKRH
ncbi:MAG: YXWGXW repeat-containing protein [Bacteroidales bacterium]|nr:YXWGXW repeat-containing protein [Bacteroidales bacterium]